MLFDLPVWANVAIYLFVGVPLTGLILFMAGALCGVERLDFLRSLLLAAVHDAILALVAWMTTRAGRQAGLALVYLAFACAALGAAYHHWRQEVYAPDDIGNHATAEPRPARLRGVIEELLHGGQAVQH